MDSNATIPEATERLAEAIRESDECRQYAALREAVMENETNRALLKEYQRTQTKLQMAAVAGATADEEDVKRFQQLSSLLYMNPDVSQYLLAQLRVQQLVSGVFQSVAQAAQLDFELPGM